MTASPEKSTNKKFAVAFTVCVIFAVCLGLHGYRAGYRINLSPSVPTGVWKIEKHGLVRDGYVVVAPDPDKNPGYRLALERGYLKGSSPMLKRAVAGEGDIISYDAEKKAVTVNGIPLPMTEIFRKDTEGRPLPIGAYTFPLRLEPGTVWLSSENIRGYDSRYFGPVEESRLKKAILLWKF
jgi:conjugative transfer signal peptidase TraF